MPQLMLVNPKKRRKGRSAAQKRATRALVARNKKRSPARSASKRRRSAPVKRRTIRRRSNPIGGRGLVGKSINIAKSGAIGSAGAIVAAIVGSKIPLPVQLQAGPMRIVTNSVIGIATGYGVSKFVDRKLGENMAQGAVTVALYDAMKAQISGMIPSLGLSGYDENLLGYDESLLGMGAYDDDDDYDMGAYSDDGMGYAGAGITSDFDDDETDNGLF